MKKVSLIIALFISFSCRVTAADALPATFTTDPARLIVDLPFDLTINTSDLGDEVYLFTWCHNGPAVSWGWDGSLTPKFRMEGSGGTYSIHIESIREFYGLTDANISKVKQLGFIARNAMGQQTIDLIADVLTSSGNTYSGGSGTADSPFLLASATDLEALQAAPGDWHKSFSMEADITITDGTPIGSLTVPFRGRFDGGSHTINGFSFTSVEQNEPCGFFGCLEGATICDLGLRDVDCRGAGFTGALAGEAGGASIIERCYTTGSVTGRSICTGGLVGDNRGATIRDCYSTARVISTGFAAGGMVGKNTGSVARCYATGEVNSEGGYAGGITGANYGDVSQCVAVNTVVGSGSPFTGRAGGNSNARNEGHSNLTWDSTANTLDWADPCFGDHAEVCKSEALRQKETYPALGWDFDTVWEWRIDEGRGWPALRNLTGQVCSMPDALYGTTGNLPEHYECTFNVKVANGVVSIRSAIGMRSMRLLDVAGRVVVTLPCHEAIDVKVPLTHLPGGIYILRVQMSDGSCKTAKITNF